MSDRVVVRVREGDLVVTTRQIWHVELGDREAEHPYLDHALAEVLGRSPGEVLDLVRQILSATPEPAGPGEREG